MYLIENSSDSIKDLYNKNRAKMANYTPRKEMNILKEKNLLNKDGEVHVGFSDLPNQIHRRTIKKAFEFTLLVCGESGLGKSTLVNSMFLTDIYSDEYPGPSKRLAKTVKVDTNKVLLKEKNVNLALTVVDTPGFCVSVNNENCWTPITNYIENRYEEYLNAETRLYRKYIPDNRVHCCLYFIYPSGHSLKQIDIDCMLNLHDKVNIIPVIAKSDTLTPEECAQFKKNVLSDINAHKIKIYEFPDYDEENTEAFKLQKQFKSKIPFAVVGSNYILDINGERKRGRKYPWGTIEIENQEHCDFIALRSMIIKYYMLDLLDTTNNVHYENFRCKKLISIGLTTPESNKSPLALMEKEKKEHDAKIKIMEQDMEEVFQKKVKEKLQKLKDNENDLLKRKELMNKEIELQRAKLEEKRQLFEKERAAFELISRDIEQINKANTMELMAKELMEKEKKKEKKKLFS